MGSLQEVQNDIYPIHLAFVKPWCVDGDDRSARCLFSHQYHRFLCFTIRDNHYQFRVILFGITSALRVFTETMVVIVVHLRPKGISIFLYIDDWLIVVDSKFLLTHHTHMTLDLLQCLGICINWKKSHLVPMQIIGVIIDSVVSFLPTDHAHSVWHIIHMVRGQQVSPAVIIQR